MPKENPEIDQELHPGEFLELHDLMTPMEEEQQQALELVPHSSLILSLGQSASIGNIGASVVGSFGTSCARFEFIGRAHWAYTGASSRSYSWAHRPTSHSVAYSCGGPGSLTSAN